MDYVFMPAQHYKDACDKIREKTETTEPIKSGEFAGKVEDVYNEGLAEGIEQGKSAEWNTFWDSYQHNGNRVNYEYAFYGWSDGLFYPKYNIVPSGSYVGSSMFRKSSIKDLKQRLEDCGVVLDTSSCGYVAYMFMESEISSIPVVDLTNAKNATDYCFANAPYIKTIEKVIFSEQTAISSNMFSATSGLENVVFEGVISRNGLNLQWSTKLSKASWQSIIGVLSANTSGLSMTGSLVSVNKAFETSEGANNGSTSTEWLNLIATKPNWTFNLS